MEVYTPVNLGSSASSPKTARLPSRNAAGYWRCRRAAA